jgi:hypothetical protein
VLTLTTAVPVAHASPDDTQSNSMCPYTAANNLSWGPPGAADDFDMPGNVPGWQLYNGIGHNGNGVRTPGAIDVHDGVLTITGDAAGNSGGVAWYPGQLYGRWELCMKAPPTSPNYHTVALLWPDSDHWPADGEIDFMEALDAQRRTVTSSVLHAVPGSPEGLLDPNDHAQVPVDATQWHSWAVEWAPDHVTGYVDGIQWFVVTRHVPTTAMHLCLQLDDFGGDISAGGAMMVDWVRRYPAPVAAPP